MQQRNGFPLLGLGCMRLPGNYEAAKSLILHALDKGVNYFDTAYVYQGKEAQLGRVLKESGRRDEALIATKIQPFLVKTAEDLEKRFQTQLDRLQTDHIDHYLIHMLPDVSVWGRLKSLGIESWLEAKKASGEIGHVGFSFHGRTETFLELLEVYPWEFCQIQYNYMDETSQAGKRGVKRAHEKGIAVIIMEPLRGGNLTEGLPSTAKEAFAQTGDSPAKWGFRWLYDQPEVSCVLSGMTTIEMLNENIAIAKEAASFDEKEHALIEEVRQLINASSKIACTGCGYCMPCPQGVDIPGSFRCYNVSYTEGYYKGFSEYLMCTTFKEKRSNVSLCTRCGICEKKCPQDLAIRESLVLSKKRLETPIYKIASFATRRMFKGEVPAPQ